MPSKRKRCVDCSPSAKRVAKYPGPRCSTHHREKRNKQRGESHAAHVEATYNITIDQYWAIYEAQGGKCAICNRATGKRRKLSVDHDHACCKGSTSCGKCVRGLCCRPCNGLLGHLRDDRESLQRAKDYLDDPPAQRIGVIRGVPGR